MPIRSEDVDSQKLKCRLSGMHSKKVGNLKWHDQPSERPPQKWKLSEIESLWKLEIWNETINFQTWKLLESLTSEMETSVETLRHGSSENGHLRDGKKSQKGHLRNGINQLSANETLTKFEIWSGNPQKWKLSEEIEIWKGNSQTWKPPEKCICSHIKIVLKKNFQLSEMNTWIQSQHKHFFQDEVLIVLPQPKTHPKPLKPESWIPIFPPKKT